MEDRIESLHRGARAGVRPLGAAGDAGERRRMVKARVRDAALAEDGAERLEEGALAARGDIVPLGGGR